MESDETCKASSSSEECRSASHVESESRRGLPGALIVSHFEVIPIPSNQLVAQNNKNKMRGS